MIHGSRVPLPPSCTLGSPSSLSATVFLVSFKPREKPFQYLGFFGSSMTQSTTLAVVTSEQREWNHDQTKLTSSLCCFASLILKRPRHSWFKSRPCPWSNVRVFFSGQFLTTLKSMVHGCQGALSWIWPTLLWNILTLWLFSDSKVRTWLSFFTSEFKVSMLSWRVPIRTFASLRRFWSLTIISSDALLAARAHVRTAQLVLSFSSFLI